MNVCICTSSFPLNRSEVYHGYLRDLIEVLNRAGHTVTVLTQDRKGQKEQFIKGVEVVWFPWSGARKEVLAELSFSNPANILSAFSLIRQGTRHANRMAVERKIDVFISLWIVPSGLYLYLKNLFFSRTPYLLWSLGSDVYKNKDNFLTRWILRRIIRSSKAVFADGFELCDIIKNISGRECTFLPTFHKIDVPLNLTKISVSRPPVFLYVGRLSRVKGPDILLDALGQVQGDFKCLILGDGEMMEELKSKVEQYSLHGKVNFLGKITDETEKAKYFTMADCVVIPSRSESIPVVLSEAVQFGKPLITSDAGDMKLLVEKYKLGYVVKRGDAAELAQVMWRFLRNPVKPDPQLRKKISDLLLFDPNSNSLLNSLKGK